MSFKEDHERWQEAVGKILGVHQLTGEMALMDFNVVLDELNSLDYYSTRIIEDNEQAWQVLLKCCALVPSNGSNNQLVSKFCQLICNILAKHKIPIDEAVLDNLLKFLTLSIQKCQQWVLLEHLHAIAAIMNENGAMCDKFAKTLIGRAPDGLLVSICSNSSNDCDIRSCAVRCVGHLCTRTENGEGLSEQFTGDGLEILLEVLQTPADPVEQEIQHFKLINTTLRVLISILGSCSPTPKYQSAQLLTILKNYIFCGLSGYELKLTNGKRMPDKNSEAQDNGLTSVEPVHHKNRSYMFKKKRRRGGAKKERPQNQPAPFRPGSKYTSYSSMDALTPSFARTSVSTNCGAKSSIAQHQTRASMEALTPAFAKTSIGLAGVEGADTSAIQRTLEVGDPLSDSMERHGNHSGLDSPDNSPEANTPQETPDGHLSDDSSSNLSGSEGFSATSSDSDLSDSEAGQAARMQSLLLRVRQNALTSLHSVIKGMDRKELFSYWSLYVPDSSSDSPWTLITLIKKDPAAKVRACAVGVLVELLDGSRPFLAAADDREERSPAAARPFTSFSAKLAALVHGLHQCLLEALAAEGPTFLRIQIVKCISALLVNSPYNRLKRGLISQIITQVRPLVSHRDPGLRVSVLTCFGMSVSVHSPLHEVAELMKPTEQIRETGDGSPEPVAFPWLVTLCGQIVNRPDEPSAVCVQGLQVLAAFLRNYFDMISPCIPWLTNLAVTCMKKPDPSLSLHGIKLLEELAKTMYSSITAEQQSNDVNISKNQLVDFWLKLLDGPLTAVLQGSSSMCPKFCSAAVDCLTNIGSQIFQELPVDKRILCITLCLGLSSDEDKCLKSSAVRALGVLVLFPALRSDVLFVADSANSVLSSMQDTALGVRIKAAWALANLSDALVQNKLAGASSFIEDFSDMLLLRLLDCAIAACEDRDKVKSNGVRAVGNFLRYVGPSSLKKRGLAASVGKAAHALASNAVSGLMKVRWNACYAIGNVFHNSALPVGTAEWTGVLFASLENVIKECKNFKVRINAVLALSVPEERRCYGDVKQYCRTWDTVTAALLGIEDMADFADYKYRDTLRQQLCHVFCHMLSFVTHDDVIQISSSLERQGEALQQHVTSYVRHVSAQNEEELQGGNSEPTSNQKTQVLSAAKQHIREDLDQSVPAVQHLAKILSG